MNLKPTVIYDDEITHGTFKCTDCGYIITDASLRHLQACPMSGTKPHRINGWHVLDVKQPLPGCE